MNLDKLYAHAMSDKAALIIIDGMLGEGKTHLSVTIADYLNSLRGFPPIDFSEQLGMGGEAFLKAMRVCALKNLPATIYDEAGDFSKRGAMTKFNMMLNRTFETFRAYKIIPILVLPSVNVLDNSLFMKGIPQLLLNCYNREPHEGHGRGYSFYRMEYLRKKMKMLTVVPQAYRLVHPNFHFDFYPLEPERAAKLNALSTSSKLDILLAQSQRINNLYTIKDIMQHTGLRDKTISTYLNKMNIKAKEKVNRINYYDESALKALDNRKVHRR